MRQGGIIRQLLMVFVIVVLLGIATKQAEQMVQEYFWWALLGTGILLSGMALWRRLRRW